MKVVARLECPENQGVLTRISQSPDGRACTYSGQDSEVSLRIVAMADGDPAAALAPVEAELKALTPTLPASAEAEASKSADDGEDGEDGDPAARTESSEHVRINMPGLHIAADDGGADVKIGRNMNITAHDDGADVRSIRNGQRSVRAMLILARDSGKTPYPVVGYEARGPKSGPLVIAVVKSRQHDNTKDGDVFDDMKKLVKRNVGG